jgi:hypothetical protein
MTSKLVAFTHIKLAAINKAKPIPLVFYQNYLKEPRNQRPKPKTQKNHCN